MGIRMFENAATSGLGFRLEQHVIDCSNQPAALFYPEKRAYFSLLWFQQGEGKYFIDFTEHTFVANTMVIISKDQIYYFAAPQIPFTFTEISFGEDFTSRSNAEVMQLLSFCIREHFAGKQVFTVSPSDATYLQTLTQQMQHVYTQWAGYEQSESLFHLLQLFLVYCTKLRKEQSMAATDAYYEVVGNFTALIEENFKQTQKVNDYCDQLYLTYNTLSRYTKAYCGKSPKEIIAERVVLEAKRMLSVSDLSVKEIAYELGFDEPTNLVKYFKKQTGYTPAAFRQNFIFSLN